MGRIDFESGIFDPDDYIGELDGFDEFDRVEGNVFALGVGTSFLIENGLARDDEFDLDTDGGRFVTAAGRALRDRVLAMDISAVTNEINLSGIGLRRTELEIDPLGGENVELMVGMARSFCSAGLFHMAEEILTIERTDGRFPRWPNDADAMALLAEIYSRKKGMLKVVDLLSNKDGTPKFPDNLSAMRILLKAYNNLGRYADTVAAVDLINVNGDFFYSKEILSLYLLALYRQGLYDQVVKICVNNAKIPPSIIDRSVLTGFIIDLHRAGKYSELCVLAMPFADTEPYCNDPKFISTVTSALNELHRYQESLDLLMSEDAGCRFPDDQYCLKHFLYCLIYLNRFAEASRMVAWLEKSGRLKRNWGPYMGGAIKYLELQMKRVRQKSAGFDGKGRKPYSAR